MIDLKFTEEDREILNYERFHHPHPRVQLKIKVLWLKSQNLPLNLIYRLAKVSPNTLRSYCQQYKIGGVEKLKEINFYQPKSVLKLHQETIQNI